MTVISMRKRDLQLNLMYASNQQCCHAVLAPEVADPVGNQRHLPLDGEHEHSMEIIMKQIHSHNTHRYDFAPTFTFGELAYEANDKDNHTLQPVAEQNNNRNSHTPWKLRVVCGTYDESLYVPDEEAMHMFYHRQRN